MKPPNDPTDTSVQSRKNEALAKRKRATVKRLLREICELTGKKRIRIDFAIVGPADTSTPAATAPSHAPSRHPACPLPPPKQGRRQVLGGHPHSALTFELERRKEAAAKWCEVNGHHPAIHTTRPSLVDWGIKHDPDCSSHRFARDCDCERLFLTRIDGHAFSVNEDGSLEPFHEPEPGVAAFADDWLTFFMDKAWTVEEWATHAIDRTILEFTSLADADGTEHFLDMPSEYNAPKPIETHE